MTEALVEIRLLGLPIAVQRETNAHYDALLREFELIRQSDTVAETTPMRLLNLIDELSTRFDEFTEQPRTILEEVHRQGGDTVDLVYELPSEAIEACRQLRALLDEADAYCLAGEHLVTLASPPAIRSYREWFLGEFIEQSEGRAPRSWSEWETEGGDGLGTTASSATEATATTSLRDAAASIGAESNGDAKRWLTELNGDTAAVTLRGEIDLLLAPSLRDHLNRLHADGVRNFMLDTKDLTFIDSVGLSVLLALYRRCREEDGTITLVRPSPSLRRTLEISGLLDVLNVS
ncbi:MAG TPA: STAS domain-containing protein [Acidimicrobiales bacterium]